jgi:hypothetical protein
MAASLERLLEQVAAGNAPQALLVSGEMMLAEPAAARLAAAWSEALGLAPEAVARHRRPPSLAPLLQDLRTFSLFAAGKVVVAVDTAAFADKDAAGPLLGEAAAVLPVSADGSLSPREREGAIALLQALRLYDLDPYAGSAEAAVGRLPDEAFGGGKGKAKKGGGGDLKAQLAGLLEAARREELQGLQGSDLAELADLLHGGLPPGHVLIFAERSAAPSHPLVRLLAERGAAIDLGQLESDRGAFQGLEPLVAELERQTGAGIARDALNALAQRTLRQAGRGGAGIDPTSSGRFAAEYRKLANLANGGRIDKALVERAVEDRGQEDVWQLLDAVSAGKGGEALSRLHRLLAGADDMMAERLSFFSLLAGYCRQLTAIRGLMKLNKVPGGEESYPRFKSRWAPALQGEMPIGKNPVAGLHPFRLHRVYLAASRFPEGMLARLPADVLDTELALKGESDGADTALARLVARLAVGR